LTAQSSRQFYTGVILVLFSAFLFSGKAILAKLVYRESDIDVINVLFMRMLYALPFYAISLFVTIRKRGFKTADGKPMNLKKIAYVAFLGVLGYYISSFFDFIGLKYVSAGLERIILFAYPAIVVIIETVVFKQPLTKMVFFSLLLCYAGIAISFGADIKVSGNSMIWWGSLSVLLCAFTFACYVVFSSKIIPSVGVALFTPVAMLGATLGIAVHAIIKNGFNTGFTSNPKLHVYFLLMGVLSTVVPSYLNAWGLRHIGSSNVAIVSSIGPFATIFLAWWLLQEPFGLWQLAGSLLVIAGVVLLSSKSKHRRA